MPMRTEIGGPSQLSAMRPSWMVTAAATACAGVGKAAENESPPVANTKPCSAAMASRMMRSWTARLAAIPSPSVSQRRVDPSTSVNRNVMVPEGMTLAGMKLCPSHGRAVERNRRRLARVWCVAEGVGFEPTEPVKPAQQFSRLPPSSARPSLRVPTARRRSGSVPGRQIDRSGDSLAPVAEERLQETAALGLPHSAFELDVVVEPFVLRDVVQAPGGAGL